MWEFWFTGRIKATIIRNALSSSSLLHPTLSTTIYSTWPLASMAPHRMSFQYDHTWTREYKEKINWWLRFSVPSAKMQMCFFNVLFFLNMWGLKQQIYQFLSHCGCFSRWTLGCIIHKNILSFCTYPVKTDKREFDIINVMPFSVVLIPSFQPSRTTLTLWCQVLKLTVSFFSYYKYKLKQIEFFFLFWHTNTSKSEPHRPLLHFIWVVIPSATRGI